MKANALTWLLYYCVLLTIIYDEAGSRTGGALYMDWPKGEGVNGLLCGWACVCWMKLKEEPVGGWLVCWSGG